MGSTLMELEHNWVEHMWYIPSTGEENNLLNLLWMQSYLPILRRRLNKRPTILSSSPRNPVSDMRHGACRCHSSTTVNLKLLLVGKVEQLQTIPRYQSG